MDTNSAGQAVVPGWTAPRSTTGEGVDAALRNHAVALANVVASVPAETPINIEALGTPFEHRRLAGRSRASLFDCFDKM